MCVCVPVDDLQRGVPRQLGALLSRHELSAVVHAVLGYAAAHPLPAWSGAAILAASSYYVAAAGIELYMDLNYFSVSTPFSTVADS